MSDAAPFPDNAWLTYREATQRWGLQMRKDQAEYIRKDASDMAIAAARAEGVRVAASLAAAISLLERGGKAAKKAAPSDKMFDQMLIDYRAALDAFRKAYAEAQP